MVFVLYMSEIAEIGGIPTRGVTSVTLNSSDAAISHHTKDSASL